MRKKRSTVFQLFVLFWSVLFLFGMYIVFLFLDGYSFFESRVLQRGYVSFSSSSPLFLNGEYLHKKDFYGQREVGKYVLCVDEFGKSSECYGGVEVGENDKVSQSLTDLFVLSASLSDMVFELSNVDDILVFADDETAVLWYDKGLRQVFYVNSFDEKMLSVFPNFVVKSVVFDAEKNGFLLVGKKEELFVRLPFLDSNVLGFGGMEDKTFEFLNLLYSKVSKSDSFFEKTVSVLRGVYAQELYKSCDMRGGRRLLFFDNSVYLFSEQREHFSFLVSKDPQTKVVCNVLSGSAYFIKENILMKISL